MSDRRVQQLLAANARVEGFCNAPDPVLDLQLVDNAEVYTRPYKIPERHAQEVDKKVFSWLAAGKIMEAPPNCPFNSPLTAAPKKDDNGNYTGTRTCLDTRLLNRQLVTKDKYQIPSSRDNLEAFEGCIIFSELDLEEAYLQFPLSERSRPFTAFIWKDKQYMFTGCPFGISILPSWFQRFMSRLFAHLPFVMPYFDNLPIGSKTVDEHLDHLITVLSILNENNLKVKPSSIHICHSQLVVLGYLLHYAKNTGATK